MAGAFALYRYFDSTDRLLYIGISGDLAMRDTTHISRSRWMELAARSAIERHLDLESLKAAERRAIETERPIFNVQYNDTPEAKERLVAYLTEIGRTDLLPSPKKPGGQYHGRSLVSARGRLSPPPPPRGLADENALPFFAPSSCTNRGEACVRRDVQDGCFGDSGPGFCVYGEVPKSLTLADFTVDEP